MVYVKHLRSMDNGLVVLWDWTYLGVNNETSSEDESAGDYSASEDKTHSSESDEEKSIDTVTFKFVGVTRDRSYQDALTSANMLIREGKEVPVVIEAEPNNPSTRELCALSVSWGLSGM